MQRHLGELQAVITVWWWEDQTGGRFDCSSNSLLIHQLTALLLFTAEGNPASSIQKTQIPLLAFFFFFSSFHFFHWNTRTHTAPSLFLRTTLHPPAILQGSGWISGAEQLQIGISCARLAESCGRKKANPLVGSPTESRGVRPRRSPGQLQQTKRLSPALPGSTFHCLTMVAMEVVFHFITVSTCPGGRESDTFFSLPLRL